jgi:hypothetical protein
MKFKSRIKAGVKTDGQRLYPAAVLTKAIEEYKSSDKQKFVVFAQEPGNFTNLKNVVGIIEDLKLISNPVEFDGVGFIEANVKLLDTPLYNSLEALLNLGMQFTIEPVGIGSVDQGVVQDDYKILYFSLENKNVY